MHEIDHVPEPSRGASLTRRFHPEVEFGGFTELDGSLRFYARVRELLPPDGVALDIGCGRGTQREDPVRVRRELRTLRGHCRRVIGIDVDPAGAENESLDEFRLIEPGKRWPVDSATADVAVADWVLEHVPDPDEFFAEAWRVLKPGGVLCVRTINRRSYVGVASRAVPERLHARLLGRLQPDRAAADVFETRYRCNTPGRLRRALDRNRFEAAVYTVDDEPSYLTFNPIAYRLGMAHRRLAPAAIRVCLIAWARRPYDRPGA